MMNMEHRSVAGLELGDACNDLHISGLRPRWRVEALDLVVALP